MAIDDAAKFEIDFRLRQKEGEFQQAVVARERHQGRGAGRRRRGRAGTAGEGERHRRQPRRGRRGDQAGAVSTASHGRSTAADTACTMTAFTGGGFGFPGGGRGGRVAAARTPRRRSRCRRVRNDQVAHCEPSLHDSGERARDRAVLAPQGRGGTLYVRRRCAVRPADAADAVLRAGHAGAAGRRGGRRRLAGAASLRRRHLQRREADRAAGRAGVVGARCRRRSRSSPPRPSARRGRRSGKGAATAASAPSRVPTRPPSADREVRVTVVNDTVGPADTTVRLEVPQGWSATPASQPITFERADESRTVRFDVKPAPTAMNGEFHIRAIATLERADLRSRLRSDRVPAHPPLSHLRQRGGDAESDRRADAGEPEDRLRDGRRRPGAAGHRTAGREGRDDQPGRSRVGQAVAVRRDRHRRPRLRAPRRPARQQPSSAGLRVRMAAR